MFAATVPALPTGGCPYCVEERKLRGRAVGQWMIPPDRVLPELPVLAIGLSITTATQSATTHQPKKGEELRIAQEAAFRTALLDLQGEASEVAARHDDGLQSCAQAAIEEAAVGQAVLAGLPPAHEAILSVRSDLRLAADREAEGDDGHTGTPLRRRWVVLLACLVAILDVALYWEFIFNLGSVDSALALVKWGAAGCLAVIWAAAMDFALHAYQGRERVSREHRSALGDHNRVHRAAGFDREGRGTASAIRAEINVADRTTRLTYGFVLLITMVNVLLISGRVASMVRAAGRSVPEAAIFGLALGMILCTVFAAVTILVTRGNELGDRLRDGGVRLDELADQHEQPIEDAANAVTRSARHIAVAEVAGTHGLNDRLWVMQIYRRGIEWARGEMGVVELPVRPEEITALGMPVRENGSMKVEQARRDLSELRTALETARDTLGALRSERSPAAREGSPGEAPVIAVEGVNTTTVSRFLPPQEPAAPTVIVPSASPAPPEPAMPELPPELPRTAWWLPVAGAAVAATAALTMAVMTPSPTDAAEVVQTEIYG